MRVDSPPHTALNTRRPSIQVLSTVMPGRSATAVVMRVGIAPDEVGAVAGFQRPGVVKPQRVPPRSLWRGQRFRDRQRLLGIDRGAVGIQPAAAAATPVHGLSSAAGKSELNVSGMPASSMVRNGMSCKGFRDRCEVQFVAECCEEPGCATTGRRLAASDPIRAMSIAIACSTRTDTSSAKPESAARARSTEATAPLPMA